MHFEYSTLKKTDISYLEDKLIKDNELQILSYQDLKEVSHNDIMQFCVKHGFYCLPTLELIEFLKEEIGEKFEQTIEVGAGHGAISRYLGIRAVDNYMQEVDQIKALYEAMRQTPVSYGSHVQRIDGNSAVQKYNPSIVIGAYCTHLYNAKEHWRGGNIYGFDEKKIIKKVQKYIHIGNEHVHSKKPILKFPKREVKAEWLMGRSQYNSRNVIWIWEK